jgi:hypothetical protein
VVALPSSFCIYRGCISPVYMNDAASSFYSPSSTKKIPPTSLPGCGEECASNDPARLHLLLRCGRPTQYT